MIDQIRADEKLRERIVSLGLKEKRYLSFDSGMEDVIQKLYEIYDTFEGIDRLMQEIQIKNTAYTKASIDKMIYLLSHDRSVKAKMADIIMKFFTFSEEQKNMVSSAIRLFQQNYLDEKSLFARSGRKIRSTEPSLRIQAENEKEKEKALDEFLSSARNAFSHQRIMQYMGNLFGDKTIIHSDEMPVTDDENFILLILASLKIGEKRVFYDVEFLDGTIYKTRYRYPKIRFIKKRKETNDRHMD